MWFESFAKSLKGIWAAHGEWQAIPNYQTCHRECPGCNFCTHKRNVKIVHGGRWTKTTSRNIGVENIREISRLFIPQRFESHTPNFEIDSFTHRKPVQLLENRCNVIEALISWHNACNGVLDPLELGKVSSCHAIEERIAVIDSWGDYGTCNFFGCWERGCWGRGQ